MTHPARRNVLSAPSGPAAAAPGPPRLTTPTDPGGRYAYGLLVLDLTDRLNGAPGRAAALVDQILNPADGLLARLAEFFEAPGDKAKESEDDDATSAPTSRKRRPTPRHRRNPARGHRAHGRTRNRTFTRAAPAFPRHRRRHQHHPARTRPLPLTTHPLPPGGSPLATRSFIARPTESGGYEGVYVHWDGYPSHHLALLLAAYQHRFASDLDAMTRHLIDNVPVGWSALGTDLLDDAPDELITALTRGERYTSDQLDLITPDGSPPTRMTVRDGQASGLDWGYVLHGHGIEVISLREEQRGPVVGWDTNPRTRFSDHPVLWQPNGPVPCRPPSPEPKLTTTPVPPAAAPAATTHTARR